MIRWPFTRKPRTPTPCDWAPGDLAERIGEGVWSGDGIGPETGDVCKVMAVNPGMGMVTFKCCQTLRLRGFSGAFAAGEFRKVEAMRITTDREAMTMDTFVTRVRM